MTDYLEGADELLIQVDYLVNACESDPANAAKRSSPDRLYELAVGLAAAVHQFRAERSPEPSPDLRERVWEAVADELGYAPTSDREKAIDALMRVIAAEVSARVSEARVDVPEPLAIGTLADAEHHNEDGIGKFVVLHVVVEEAEFEGLLDTEVALYPADLAQQVCDREQDREGLERELEAMRSVARRRLAGDYATREKDKWVWFEDGKQITDPERDALKRLEETDGD